jgi:hypothetical protein
MLTLCSWNGDCTLIPVCQIQIPGDEPMRIQILVMWRHKKLDFDMKNMLYEDF